MKRDIVKMDFITDTDGPNMEVIKLGDGKVKFTASSMIADWLSGSQVVLSAPQVDTLKDFLGAGHAVDYDDMTFAELALCLDLDEKTIVSMYKEGMPAHVRKNGDTKVCLREVHDWIVKRNVDPVRLKVNNLKVEITAKDAVLEDQRREIVQLKHDLADISPKPGAKPAKNMRVLELENVIFNLEDRIKAFGERNAELGSINQKLLQQISDMRMPVAAGRFVFTADGHFRIDPYRRLLDGTLDHVPADGIRSMSLAAGDGGDGILLTGEQALEVSAFINETVRDFVPVATVKATVTHSHDQKADERAPVSIAPGKLWVAFVDNIDVPFDWGVTLSPGMNTPIPVNAGTVTVDGLRYGTGCVTAEAHIVNAAGERLDFEVTEHRQAGELANLANVAIRAFNSAIERGRQHLGVKTSGKKVA